MSPDRPKPPLALLCRAALLCGGFALAGSQAWNSRSRLVTTLYKKKSLWLGLCAGCSGCSTGRAPLAPSPTRSADFVGAIYQPERCWWHGRLPKQPFSECPTITRRCTSTLPITPCQVSRWRGGRFVQAQLEAACVWRTLLSCGEHFLHRGERRV